MYIYIYIYISTFYCIYCKKGRDKMKIYFIENLLCEAFFFRFSLLKNFLQNIPCKNTLNHLNVTIHNKNNSIRSTTCFKKARCSNA